MSDYTCSACWQKFSVNEELHIHFKQVHSFEARQAKRAKLREAVEPEPQPGPSREDTSVPIQKMPVRLSTSPNPTTQSGSDGTSFNPTTPSGSQSESDGTSPNPTTPSGSAGTSQSEPLFVTPPSSTASSPVPDEPITLHALGLMCPVCNKEQKNKSALKNHMDIHKGLMPFQCPICKRGYETDLKLLGHATLAHNHDAVFECGGCGKTYTTEWYLKKHQKSKNCRDPLVIDISDSD